MFERYESVQERIGVVANRFRAMRFWWSIAIIASVASMLGAWLLLQARGGHLPIALAPSQLAISLIALTFAGILIAVVFVRYSYRNPRWVATQIESRFPSLQQRLLTALSQKPQADDRELGYLQRQVITDAYRHSQTHRWTEAVPRGAALLSRLTGGLSLMVLAIVTTLLFVSKPKRINNARASFLSSSSVLVEPGNTEVEKGSGLVVSARYASLDLMPESLELLTRISPHNSNDSAEVMDSVNAQRIVMTQSLDDPLMSAYIPTIEKPFQYQVKSSYGTSDTYSVDVFEFPGMLRADATLDFPDYTDLETKTIEDTVRVSAVEGSKLSWRLKFNKPMTTVSIRGKDGEEAAFDPSTLSDGYLLFDVPLTQSERWTVELIDDKGRKNKYPVTLNARVTPNQAPQIKIIQGGDLVASPLEEIGLTASVQDDFGVIRAGITYSLSGQETKDVVIIESAARGSKHNLEHMIALESLMTEPDDLLSYHFWAEDHAPDGSVRRTQGDLYFAEIRPFEEIFREGEAPAGGQPPSSQQGGSQQSEELAELQKQIIAATWKVARDPKTADESETFVADTELLQESQQQAIELAAELAAATDDEKSQELIKTLTQQMQDSIKHLSDASTQRSKSPLTDALAAEQAAYQTLLRLRAREFQVSRSQQSQSQQSGSASAQQRQQQLDQLELENDENRYETQSQAADANQQDAQREDRQILSRLRELAQRQEDINKQLAQLQSALEQAKSEEEKEEARRQLKRLREQEQELLRESDELADRMQQQENNEQKEQQAEQLEQTRENLRRSSEALEQDNVAEALTAGTRVERELDELSEEFRKRAAGEFNEVVRELRLKAQELDEAQQEIGKQLSQLTEDAQPGLRANDERETIQQALDEQKKSLTDLMDKVQQTVEEAEPSEPLLAQNLYESFRKAQQKQLDGQMTRTNEMLERGLDPEAQLLQQQVADGTRELRQNLENAAESVLGDEAKALERALSELERLDESLRAELAQSRTASPNNPNENESENATDNDAQQQGGQPSEQTPNDNPQSASSPSASRPSASPQGAPRDASESQAETTPPPGDQSPSGQPGESRETPSSQGQPSESSGRRSAQATGSSERGGMLDQLGSETSAPANGSAISSPIAGGGFREWSDALRDVEEMVSDPALRSEAAVIRDRARQMRAETLRHSRDPQWELVESMIAKPLRELKLKVSEELLRRTSERTEPVPIDRDPVPDEFSNAVRKYYESLGSGR